MEELRRGASETEFGRNEGNRGPRPGRRGNGARVRVHGQRLLGQPRSHAGARLFLQEGHVALFKSLHGM